jgi:hypothetical protein
MKRSDILVFLVMLVLLHLWLGVSLYSLFAK